MNERQMTQNEKICEGFKNIQRGFMLGPADKRNMIAIELSENRIKLLRGILTDVKTSLEKHNHLSAESDAKLGMLFHLIRQLDDPILPKRVDIEDRLSNIEHSTELARLEMNDRLSGLEIQLNKIEQVDDITKLMVGMIHKRCCGAGND